MTHSDTTFEPPDTGTLAARLQTANAMGQTILLRGSGTKLTWGPPLAPVDAVISTRQIASPIDHRPGDLTATIPAGATLTKVNELLARERQWLPLDPQVSPDATIGGIVATNDSGPRRHRYGTPRDLIIGVDLVLADGRTVRAGGQVVKNVAGYDLSRLLCGSFGSLAVVTGATFKLAPLPPASRTLVTAPASVETLTALALAVASAPLTPSAIELEGPPYRLAVRYESTEGASARQAAATSLLCDDAGVDREILGDDDREAEYWDQMSGHMRSPIGTLLKISVLPSRVGEVLRTIGTRAADAGLDFFTLGRVALGILYVDLTGEGRAHPGVILALRRDVEAGGGSLVILNGSDAIKRDVDAWGTVGDSLGVMRAVKASFDPSGTLCPGRGPGGL